MGFNKVIYQEKKEERIKELEKQIDEHNCQLTNKVVDCECLAWWKELEQISPIYS